jgi:hypothetical protein
LISQRLEQKRAFFAAFLTRNYFDFSVLRQKPAKKINAGGERCFRGPWRTQGGPLEAA